MDTTLSFSEFQPYFKKQWLSELASERPAHVIGGIEMEGYYDSQTSSTQVPYKEDLSVTVCDHISINRGDEIENAHKDLLWILKGGANAIFIDVHCVLNQEQLEVLFSGVQLDILHIHVKSVSTVEWFTYFQLLSSEIELNGSLCNHHANEPSETKVSNIKTRRFSTSNSNLFGFEEVGVLLAQAHEDLISNTVSEWADNFFFEISINAVFMEQIAKLRALRLTWAHVLKQYEIGLSTTITAKLDPLKNEEMSQLISLTSQCMSSILGGADFVNMPLVENSRFGHRMNRNIQHLLLNEAHLKEATQMAEGSYYLDELTEKLATKAVGLLRYIESEGGFTAWKNKGGLDLLNQPK